MGYFTSYQTDEERALQRAMTKALLAKQAAEALPDYPGTVLALHKQAKREEARLAVLAARNDRLWYDYRQAMGFYRSIRRLLMTATV